MSMLFTAQTIKRSVLLAFLLLVSASQASAELPGIWGEFEAGGWNNNAKEASSASGGKRVSWFDQDGRAIFVPFDVKEAMPGAVLFIRYSRARSNDSFVEVAFGPGKRAQDAKTLTSLKMPPTKGWEKYQWLSLPVGDLSAGQHFLVVRCKERGGAGDLDVAGLVSKPADNWMPPNKVKDNQLAGEGETLDAPRPDDRMTAEDLDKLRQQREALAAKNAVAAQRRAHISASENRLDYQTLWVGNDITVGPDISPDLGHTVHDVASIFVTGDGTVFTNVHWEESGANVSQYKDGRWINDARVGNHGGGEAIAVSDKHVFFAGNCHRTGKAGIDRRDRQNISNEAANLHVDAGTVTGLAVTADRVLAGVAAENRVKVYDHDLKPLGDWEVQAPGKMCLDAEGQVWILQSGLKRIVRYSPEGKPLPQQITLDKEVIPSAIWADKKGRLLIGDAGPAEQALIFENITTTPTFATAFGEKGGIYAGTAGKLGARRFCNISGLGTDDAGNLYIASRPRPNGSTILQGYSPTGELLWQRACLVWMDNVAIDPEDPSILYSSKSKFRMNLDAKDGSYWTPLACTVDRHRFSDDYRVQAGGAGATFLHRLSNGQRYQYIVNMTGKTVYAYRFDPKKHGEIAIPAGYVDQGGVWVDQNDDGRRDSAGAAGMTFDLTLKGTYQSDSLKLELSSVDSNGHRQSLTHSLGRSGHGQQISLGAWSARKRAYVFKSLQIRVGSENKVVYQQQFASDTPPTDTGFNLGDGSTWTQTPQGLRLTAEANEPRSFSLSREIAELTEGQDFEVRLQVTAPRNRLFRDRFGFTVLGQPGKFNSGIAAIIDAGMDMPLLQFRKGLGNRDVVAQKQLSEEVVANPARMTVGSFVDSQGTIWNATHAMGLYRYPISSFTPAGAPIYTGQGIEKIDMPKPFTELRRIYFAPERNNMMLLNGFTDAHPNSKHHWKRGGKVICRYDNWAPGQWNLKWELVPPYEDRTGANDGDGNIMSMDVAGDYLFVCREGQSSMLGVNRGHVDVYRLEDAAYVGWMEPAKEVGHVGIIDITHGLRAYHDAKKGEYLVFLEDSGRARMIVYRWKPKA